jgi:hypothetical protein
LTKIGIIQNIYNGLRLYYDKQINKDKNKIESVKYFKGKNSRDFIFNEDKQKYEFIFIVRKNFYNLDETFLKIEQIKVG